MSQVPFIIMRHGCEAETGSCPLSHSSPDSDILAALPKYHLNYHSIAETFNEWYDLGEVI